MSVNWTNPGQILESLDVTILNVCLRYEKRREVLFRATVVCDDEASLPTYKRLLSSLSVNGKA